MTDNRIKELKNYLETWNGNLADRQREEVEKFGNVIQNAGYVATIRRSRGQDILGACGQLRTESQKIKQI